MQANEQNLESAKLTILLVGNYQIDQQKSMERFARMLESGLVEHGHQVRLIRPQARFGHINFLGRTVAKWLAYIDKFIIFPRELARAARSAHVTHICDHSNALYIEAIKDIPHLITCHDLLAVRAGLGQDTCVQLSATGKLLQRLILNGLRQARLIVCDSTATLNDARRLLPCQSYSGIESGTLRLVLLGLNFPFSALSKDKAEQRLASISDLNSATPYLLHVGSSLPRKNRAMIVRTFARIRHTFAGQLVFAGSPLPPDIRRLAVELGVSKRVVQIVDPGNNVLEALYNRAFALLYPSVSEGFGWPVIEAQACGCPVVCSNAGPLPEVSGQAARMRDPDDLAGFAADILALYDGSERQRLIQLGLENVKRFGFEKMIGQYERIYFELVSQNEKL